VRGDDADADATAAPATPRALPIAARGITRRFGAVTALDAVDLDIRAGEFLTLLGPSGSGKTTLLMVLAGFERPDAGSLRFGDAEVIRLPPHRRDLGMVFQSYALFPHMSVAGNVGYPLRVRGVAKAEIAERVDRALETVDLAGYGERRIAQLSGGQRQRVALARAIVFAPRILLMDEPLSALDKKLRERMQIELRRLHERLGMTTVYVTHDQREALTMSDRVAVIDRGRLMQVAAPRSLYDRPANRFVADFVGESAFLPVARDGDRVTWRGAPLRTPPPPRGDRLALMLRPERVRVLGPGEAADNLFHGIAADVVLQGDSWLLTARLEDGAEVGARGATLGGALDALPGPGEPVTLGVAAADAALVADD
jgi:putative spermidine/putrescine transport system ATP-binding protein